MATHDRYRRSLSALAQATSQGELEALWAGIAFGGWTETQLLLLAAATAKRQRELGIPLLTTSNPP